MRSKLYLLMAIVMIAVMALSACAPAAVPTEAPVVVPPTEAPPPPAPTEVPPTPEPTAIPYVTCGTADKPCVITFVPIGRSW